MKIYVLTEISSGENPLEFDNQEVYTDKEKAKQALVDKYLARIKMSTGYDTFGKDFRSNGYRIVIADDDTTTIYEGYLKEYEIC